MSARSSLDLSSDLLGAFCCSKLVDTGPSTVDAVFGMRAGMPVISSLGTGSCDLWYAVHAARSNPSSFWTCRGIPITVDLLCFLRPLVLSFFPWLRGVNVDPWRESADRVDLEEMVDCVETVDMQSVAVLSDPIDLLLSVPLLTSF